MNKTEIEKEINELNEKIEAEPENAVYYNKRGVFYHFFERYEEALKDFTRAIELDPDDALYHNNRGNCYSDLKRYKEALNDYTKAVELNPEYEGAMNSYTRLIELDSDNAEFHSDCGSDLEKVSCTAILQRNLGVEASNAFNYLIDKKDSDNPEEITANLGRIRNIFDNILRVIAKDLKAPAYCWNRKIPNQIVMTPVIKWIVNSTYDEEERIRNWNYRFGSNRLIKNFLFDIQEIGSDFGPHRKLTSKPSGYQPTSDTVNSLFYALKDLIRWFGEICGRQP